MERFENIHLSKPNPFIIALELLGLRPINPADICKIRKDYYLLVATFPELLGDQTSIGPGDDGHCQLWQDNPGWWKKWV